MTLERVVITGLGAVSALGCGADTNFEQALEGHSGIDFLTLPSERQRPATVAAQIRFPLPDLIKRAELPLFDRFAQLGWTAAHEALQQSGLSTGTDTGLLENSGVFWGTGMGGAGTLEAGYVDLFVEGKDRVRPMSIVASMNNAAAAQIAMRCGFGGTVNNYSSACVSSAQAIGEAYRHIRHGYAERVLAGGSEALLTYGVVSAWDALRVLAPADAEHPERSCRPFSGNRSGLVLGEGGAAVMLESLSSAKSRGATILAELVGYGTSNDAVHITKPDPAGQGRAMRMALADAKLSATGIDYINAHGAGTPAGDLAETESIKQVFGDSAHKLMVSSTKSMHGHTLGAAGALEFVMTVQTLRNKAVPPTAFLDHADPACDLDYVPLHARRNQEIRAAMSNSFAFGGSNVALIVQGFTED
ncbi:beta-ketoacyl-[acyl-carrier-protein] synthase family protein [Undibacterium terreum]|uniref:Nodulation protein E n=1 Tax=Undibacterium terreum TaxID=1224302 RepID=A0A916U914_9BURK|nr:beta-ketoacyl-[acyl-carrier-protein] synthase family protein [Undibacterium terreum]GGC63597.1 beta-ketoacyl-[acyl-carrier-protein] synthase II [Undibacterium terreum]